MARIVVSITFAAALSLSTLPVTAQRGSEYRGTQQEQEACTPDVHRLCAAYIPDEKRIVACLRANIRRLSPACRKVFSRR
jgi:hypothetical protein